MDKSHEIKLLASSICDCSEVKRALDSQSHPCHKVVAVQNEMVANDKSQRQRPEPWIGNLAKAKVLFLSSNPSITPTSATAPDRQMPAKQCITTFLSSANARCSNEAS